MLKVPHTTHPVRLYLYSHDITSPPWIFKKLLKEAEMVVQPRNEEDLLEVFEYAKENRIPITPRGAGTSGYGGAVPYKGGIIIDFSRMNKFEILEDEKLVVAEPGAVWWDIEKEAEKKGLMLRVYPTSAPSSTVGGWIASGGFGVGSLKYGSIADNVEKLRVIDFRGVRETANAIFYAGLCGTTGLIAKAWVKLKDYVEHRVYGMNTDIGFMIGVGRNRPENITSVVIYGFEYMKLKKELENPELSEYGACVVEYEDPNASENEFGRKLWESRFYPLRVKRKGPSIIASEVIVPYSTAVDFVFWLEREEIPYEVWFTNRGAVVLSFFFDDERRFGYSLAWRKSVKVLRKAEKMGGKPYSVGMFLSHKAKKYFENYDELLRFKKIVDPHNILNPGKVFPTVLTHITRIANAVMIV